MTWIWIIFGVLVVVAGLRYRQRLHAGRRPRAEPSIDDDAIRHIIGTGQLPRKRDEGRLDMKAAERAEREFWAESWDEPDEYRA